MNIWDSIRDFADLAPRLILEGSLCLKSQDHKQKQMRINSRNEITSIVRYIWYRKNVIF